MDEVEVYSGDDTTKSNYYTVNRCYAHGYLEDWLGYDIIVTKEDWIPKPGITRIKVTRPDGESKHALLLTAKELGNNPSIRGYAILENDPIALFDACNLIIDIASSQYKKILRDDILGLSKG